ncbi:response regulator [Corallincola luteus]|uniref:Response regulator n=1 Tax=Corallincola luteus TaxID=1775177 RepID=A0ABY2AP51_9GAMM|nr:response regulator [Corallincola luteus]TCI04970.1 response regulator [Corallincola luteus]
MSAVANQFYKRQRLLVVDDCAPIRTAIKGMLQTLGCEDIQTAANGERALALCETRPFDIVLCDYNLGDGKDGYQLFEELKQRALIQPESLFILISAENRRQVVHGVIELQPDDYLIKPFSYVSLGRRLARAFIKKHSLASVYQALRDENLEDAAEQCYLAVKNVPEHKLFAMRMRGELLVKLGHYQRAFDLYAEVLSERDHPWAMLGLAITRFHLGQIREAKLMFEALLERAEVRVESFDWLGRVAIRAKQLEAAQEFFVEASKLSPRNIERQRAIAHLAMANDQLEMAVKAHKKIVEGIRHSVHETPLHHLNYARCLVDLAIESNDLVAVRCVNRAQDVLRDTCRRFNSELLDSQNQILNSRISVLKGDIETARVLLDPQLIAEPLHNIEDQLDKAKALFGAGEPEQAEEVMSQIAQMKSDDELSAATLGVIVERESQRQRVFNDKIRQLNSDGMELYQIGAYGEALDCFIEAFDMMPHSASLALNLAQALSKAWSSKLSRLQVLALGKRCKSVIEQSPLTEHNAKRYDAIKKELESVLSSPR